MKTTIDIPAKQLRDAMRFTRATTKREAVVRALFRGDQMMTTFLRAVAAGVLVLTLPFAVRAAGAAATVQGSAGVSATAAAPFLGEWTLALDGSNGPATFTLSIKVEKEKATGEIVSDALGTLPITSMSLADKTLALGYLFTWEGNMVDAVASLTPEEDGKTRAQMDFAGGAYLMTGTATRKEAGQSK